MKLKEIVELVQQHHPNIGAQEIVKMVNRAQDEYCSRTRLLEDAVQFPLVQDQRGYSLSVANNTDQIMEIKAVDLDGKKIKRFIGRPFKRDLT
tara:strand:- start:80 stop:358 length:279 start_codon:yes stop_codon:yes gene_type:complete